MAKPNIKMHVDWNISIDPVSKEAIVGYDINTEAQHKARLITMALRSVKGIRLLQVERSLSGTLDTRTGEGSAGKVESCVATVECGSHATRTYLRTTLQKAAGDVQLMLIEGDDAPRARFENGSYKLRVEAVRLMDARILDQALKPVMVDDEVRDRVSQVDFDSVPSVRNGIRQVLHLRDGQPDPYGDGGRRWLFPVNHDACSAQRDLALHFGLKVKLLSEVDPVRTVLVLPLGTLHDAPLTKNTLYADGLLGDHEDAIKAIPRKERENLVSIMRREAAALGVRLQPGDKLASAREFITSTASPGSPLLKGFKQEIIDEVRQSPLLDAVRKANASVKDEDLQHAWSRGPLVEERPPLREGAIGYAERVEIILRCRWCEREERVCDEGGSCLPEGWMNDPTDKRRVVCSSDCAAEVDHARNEALTCAAPAGLHGPGEVTLWRTRQLEKLRQAALQRRRDRWDPSTRGCGA